MSDIWAPVAMLIACLYFRWDPRFLRILSNGKRSEKYIRNFTNFFIALSVFSVCSIIVTSF